MVAPTVLGVAAPTGYTTGNTTVIIFGNNFTGATAVTFGGVPASSFAPTLIASPEGIQAVTPAHAAGVVDIAVTTPDGTGTGVGLFTYKVPDTSAYTILLWDDSCHQFISEDGGNSWFQGATPGKQFAPNATPPPNDSGFDPHGFGTLRDTWTDGQMAINDGDYRTFVGLDTDYNGQWGIIGISPNRGVNLSFTLVDPEPHSPAFVADTNFYQEYTRGAISGNATTILLATDVDHSNPAEDAYPRISYNRGTTWVDVIGVDPNTHWTTAFMGSTASQIMYLKERNTFLRKSTDWGTTWTTLTGGPEYTFLLTGDRRMRMRCSADGQTIVSIIYTGEFWLSKNGGSSWTNTNFPGVSGTEADCSVTPDGNTIIITLAKLVGGFTRPMVLVSTNGGTSFNDVSAAIQYPYRSGVFNLDTGQCNVTPDGLGMVITFNNGGDTGILYPDGEYGRTLYANVSFDSGVTWKLCSFGADPYEHNSSLGGYTAVYMVPASSPPLVSIPRGSVRWI